MCMYVHVSYNFCMRVDLSRGHDWSYTFERKQSRLNCAREEGELWANLKIQREERHTDDFLINVAFGYHDF